jgi:hypothetical protein
LGIGIGAYGYPGYYGSAYYNPYYGPYGYPYPYGYPPVGAGVVIAPRIGIAVGGGWRRFGR